MKVKVIYVVNGDTQTEVLEAPFITHCISNPKIASVICRDKNFEPLSKIYYGQCERIEVFYGEHSDSI